MSSFAQDQRISWRKKISDLFILVINPSSSEAFRGKRRELIIKGEAKCKQYQNELDNLRNIATYYVTERREASRHLAMCLDPETNTVTDPRRLDLLMNTYREKVAICEHLEYQILKLDRDIEAITEMAATESCLSLTGYKGIRDWASETWGAYSDLVHTISTICFVGAGLTYSSIFSATRGDLGLMAWAFSLFIVGMIISVTIEAFLVQCARLEDYPFTTQRLWEIFLEVFVYTASLAVVAAICLLLLIVLQLHGSTSEPGDALLTFNFSPRPPALLGLSAIGLGLFFTLVVIGIFILANGANAMLWRRRNLRNKQKENGRRLDDIL